MVTKWLVCLCVPTKEKIISDDLKIERVFSFDSRPLAFGIKFQIDDSFDR